MYLMRLSADELHALHLEDGLVPGLEAAEVDQQRKPRASKSEKDAWRHSLPALARDLRDIGLGAVDMLVEYQLLGVEGPADVILAGVHPETHAPSYVVTELKQWRRVTAAPEAPGRFRVQDQGGRPKRHPAEQTADFCRTLITSHTALKGHEERLASLAYLHNAADSEVADLLRHPRTGLSHVFTRDSRGALIRFLRRRLAAAPGRDAAELFTSGLVSGSLDGLDAQGRLQWHGGFRLDEDPTAAQRFVLDSVRGAHTAQDKSVLVLDGITAARASRLAATATDALNRAGYRTCVLSGEGTAAFPVCDVLFCEESWLRYAVLDASGHGTGDGGPLVETMIRAARVPVFVLATDLVEPGGTGFGPLIRRTADALRLPEHRIRLDREFR
ncbi:MULTISPECIES: hypothetical protein [Streptomyces]|uniref:hypothetical protein n=1 Tax=Streptomyces TaxID=1883 RepID=UPI001F2237AE|nr:hypothetical protein [Streptomyces sp. A1-5]UJB43991.1 hypothetical protein HRD51_27175 [Streptomyces sp. A1-5]